MKDDPTKRALQQATGVTDSELRDALRVYGEAATAVPVERLPAEVTRSVPAEVTRSTVSFSPQPLQNVVVEATAEGRQGTSAATYEFEIIEGGAVSTFRWPAERVL